MDDQFRLSRAALFTPIGQDIHSRVGWGSLAPSCKVCEQIAQTDALSIAVPPASQRRKRLPKRPRRSLCNFEHMPKFPLITGFHRNSETAGHFPGQGALERRPQEGDGPSRRKSSATYMRPIRMDVGQVTSESEAAAWAPVGFVRHFFISRIDTRLL